MICNEWCGLLDTLYDRLIYKFNITERQNKAYFQLHWGDSPFCIKVFSYPNELLNQSEYIHKRSNKVVMSNQQRWTVYPGVQYVRVSRCEHTTAQNTQTASVGVNHNRSRQWYICMLARFISQQISIQNPDLYREQTS